MAYFIYCLVFLVTVLQFNVVYYVTHSIFLHKPSSVAIKKLVKQAGFSAAKQKVRLVLTFTCLVFLESKPVVTLVCHTFSLTVLVCATVAVVRTLCKQMTTILHTHSTCSSQCRAQLCFHNRTGIWLQQNYLFTLGRVRVQNGRQTH